MKMQLEYNNIVCRIVPYAQAAEEASESGTRLLVVSLDAQPPVVKLESTVKAPQKRETMKQQKASMKEKRKKDLEQRRANTFKEVYFPALLTKSCYCQSEYILLTC